MRTRRERQTVADRGRLRRPADGETGHRKDMLRQLQSIAHLRGAVADGAERASAKPDQGGRADERRQRNPRVDR